MPLRSRRLLSRSFMADTGNCRLILDFFARGDAPALAALDGDPEHRRRFDFPADFVPSVRHSEAVLARWGEERRTGTSFPFAVRDAQTGELVGGCELTPLREGVAKVSYWTHPQHRGRGVATEALRLLCIAAVSEFGVRRLELVAAADNVASRRVAIRNGFSEHALRGSRILYMRETGAPKAPAHPVTWLPGKHQ